MGGEHKSGVHQFKPGTSAVGKVKLNLSETGARGAAGDEAGDVIMFPQMRRYRLGADAVIGASCSGASKTAAEYLQLYKTPQLSPASTSAALSDSAAYPYLARTPPSDAWQSFALADVVEHLLGVERLATVNSEDTFGASGMQQFKTSAARRGLKVLASTSFANFQEDLSSSVEVCPRLWLGDPRRALW